MNIPSLFAANNSTNATSGSNGSNNTQSTPSNQLTANSFITLLAAQLQAQDPMNPMDPNQMVDELTSMNSLQQLIGIKQDLDTITGANSSSTPSNSSSTSVAAQYAKQSGLNPAREDVVIQNKIFPAPSPANS